MKVMRYRDVAEETPEMEGAQGVTVRWLISEKDDAPNFYIEAHRLTLPGQVELMVESVGAARLMFGSWAPMLAQRPSMDMVLASEIDDRDKALILGENARRVFSWPEKGAP